MGGLNPKGRVALNLGPEHYSWLRDYAERNGMTITDTVRKGLKLLRFVEECEQSGTTLLADDGSDDGPRELLIL
jgi:hypothetical protein